METVGIIYMISAGIVVIVTVVLNKLQANLIEAQKQLLDETYKSNDAIMEYCLTDILRKSVESEDYETANKCKRLIEGLNNKV